MSAPNRHKRPELERSEPIRNWSGMFGVRPRNGHRLERAEEPGVAQSGAVAAAEPAAAAAPSDPVAQGVDLGYRVIEQYLQQGQTFARAVAPGRGPGVPGVTEPQRFIEQLARSTYDLADTFLSFVSAAGAWPAAAGRGTQAASAASAVPKVGAFQIESIGRAPAEGAPASSSERVVRAGNGAGAGGSAGSQVEPFFTEPSAPLITTDVASALRTEVTVELKPGSSMVRLSAHDLRAADPALPRIAGVELETRAADNRVVVRLRVPDAQPEATYSGLIIDEASHLPRGSLTVRVLGRV